MSLCRADQAEQPFNSPISIGLFYGISKKYYVHFHIVFALTFSLNGRNLVYMDNRSIWNDSKWNTEVKGWKPNKKSRFVQRP